MQNETSVAFAKALQQIHRNQPIKSRNIAKAALPIEFREAQIEERDSRTAFLDAIGEIHRGKKPVKKAAKVTGADRVIEKLLASPQRFGAPIRNI